MQYINNFKSIVLQDTGALQSLRLSITQEELNNFWDSKTLAEMSSILTINNDYIVNFMVSQLLPPYLSSKKVVYEAFIVCKTNERAEELPVMYSYDCRIFKNHIYSIEENQFICSHVLCYKENIEIGEPVFEIVDADEMEPNRWILKIKESAILKTYASIQEYFSRLPFSSDKIVLPEEKYYFFIQEWMKCYFNYNIEITVNNFFKGLLALFENQILLEYYKTLTPEQREDRMYRRPVKVIEKPKNVEQFTLTEEHFGEIRWQTLKIVTYKLKYRVEEDEDKYICYRIKEQSEGGCEFQQLSVQDQSILLAFDYVRKNEREYTEQYSSSD